MMGGAQGTENYKTSSCSNILVNAFTEPQTTYSANWTNRWDLTYPACSFMWRNPKTESLDMHVGIPRHIYHGSGGGTYVVEKTSIIWEFCLNWWAMSVCTLRDFLACDLSFSYKTVRFRNLENALMCVFQKATTSWGVENEAHIVS